MTAPGVGRTPAEKRARAWARASCLAPPPGALLVPFAAMHGAEGEPAHVEPGARPVLVLAAPAAGVQPLDVVRVVGRYLLLGVTAYGQRFTGRGLARTLRPRAGRGLFRVVDEDWDGMGDEPRDVRVVPLCWYETPAPVVAATVTALTLQAFVWDVSERDAGRVLSTAYVYVEGR